MGMPDLWTAIQFDSAVLVFGRHVSNKLMEYENGHPKYTLAELLDIPDTRSARERNQHSHQMLLAMAATTRGIGKH